MLKFVLVLALAVFVGGSAAAVQLEEGDIVVSALGQSNIRVFHYDPSTGIETLVSGCTTAASNCSDWIGEGPTNLSPAGTIGVSSDGVVFLLAQPGGTSDHVIVEVDTLTGDRTEHATLLSNNSEVVQGIITGGAPEFAFVPAQTGATQASIPGLSGWAIPILIGFLLGASYMKGKYDGRVAA